MNLQDAEKLNVERRERSDVRHLIGGHAKRIEADRDEARRLEALSGFMGGLNLGAASLDGGGSVASETSTLTNMTMTKRTFAAANVHLDRGQQRSLTRKAKGEGFLERAAARRLPPSHNDLDHAGGGGGGGGEAAVEAAEVRAPPTPESP